MGVLQSDNFVQLLMLTINVLNGLISLFFLGVGIYILLAKWGTLSGYFFGTGLILVLFGVILGSVSTMGQMVAFFWRKSAECTPSDLLVGTRMTYSYQILQAAIVGNLLSHHCKA